MRAFVFTILLLFFSGCVSWQKAVSFGFWQSPKDELIQNLTKECDDNKSISCNNLAYEYGKDEDFKSSAEFFKRACDLNLATACANLGQIYEKGLGLDKPDMNMALSLYTLACNSGDGVGCYNIALAIYTNAPSDKKDLAFKKSIKLLDKSCKFEYKQACVLLQELKK